MVVTVLINAFAYTPAEDGRRTAEAERSENELSLTTGKVDGCRLNSDTCAGKPAGGVGQIFHSLRASDCPRSPAVQRLKQTLIWGDS
jgi:hypothetical protein